jgi:diaminohydroxyphosphoribosylaminopyrimidine deaminase / 5-amino-6-(5-phosphoribosylamino)uracil reductase
MNLDQAMRIAITEALKGAPFVSPNPKVGCVILNSQGQLLSTGYHTRFGQAHAEIEALKALSPEQLKGAHVIVTLEPCAHVGKTPSCATTLAKLPIKKVTFGLRDPNPLVSGKGAQILVEAGIEVEEYQGDLKDDLEESCEEFLWNFREKKIFVALKVAQSLDGKIALPSGESKWITGPKSRERVHALRAQYDAVLVGKNTILVDNPSLNIRHPLIQKDNKVIILDRSGEILKKEDQLKIFKVHKRENILVQPQVELKTILSDLFDRGLRSILIEGGSRVYSSFLAQGLVQRIHVFTGPVILGQGLGWADRLEVGGMDTKIQLKNIKTEKVGIDAYLTALI